MKLRCFNADLHIHTCLSPCAEAEMTPMAIVRAAKAKGLDLLAICDHNSAENALAAKKAGVKEGLRVLGGIEVTTQEEVHVLGLFDDHDALRYMQRTVHPNLPGENDEAIFGEQLICAEDDSIIGRSGRLLIGATTLTIEQVVEAIHDLAGVAIASHIDRESFGVVGRLGFVPEGLGLDALELSPRAEPGEPWDSISRDCGVPLVRFSDAHRLSDIGEESTSFEMESASVRELAEALHSRDGRRVVA